MPAATLSATAAATRMGGMGAVPNMPYRGTPPQGHMEVLSPKHNDTLIVDENLPHRCVGSIGGRVRFEGSISLKLAAMERRNTALPPCQSPVKEPARQGTVSYIFISSPEKLLRGIEGHRGYWGWQPVDARRRERNPGELERIGMSAEIPKERASRLGRAAGDVGESRDDAIPAHKQ